MQHEDFVLLLPLTFPNKDNYDNWMTNLIELRNELYNLLVKSSSLSGLKSMTIETILEDLEERMKKMQDEHFKRTLQSSSPDMETKKPEPIEIERPSNPKKNYIKRFFGFK